MDYCRYMAENFATFEYKTQEEVLTVIKFLTNILSTTGMQVLEILSPSHLLTHLRGSFRPHPPSQGALSPHDRQDESAMDVVPPCSPEKFDKPDAKQYDRPALLRTSVIIAMVMLLKVHLKVLYSLSEEYEYPKLSMFIMEILTLSTVNAANLWLARRAP